METLTCVETILALLHHSSSPISYWPLTFYTIIFLINRMTSPAANNQFSYENIFLLPPNYQKLQTFWLFMLPSHSSIQLSQTRTEISSIHFVGYFLNHNAYRCIELHTQDLHIKPCSFRGRSISIPQVFCVYTSSGTQPPHWLDII